MEISNYQYFKISGAQYSPKINFSNFQNALFSCFLWELEGIIAIFGSTTQFCIFWYAGCVILMVSTYHAKIHVDFRNLIKICKILISIVTWVKFARIWPSSHGFRAVWSSAPRNRTPSHFLKNVPDSRGLVGRSRVVGSTSVLDFIESMWDMRVT